MQADGPDGARTSHEMGNQFSLLIGGPFSRLLNRLGLAGKDRLPHSRAGIILALAAWLPPAILALAQTLLDEHYTGWGYFTDLTVYTRYLVAVAVMLATERYAEERINLLLRQFGAAQIVHGSTKPEFNALLNWADRLSASSVAEASILAATVIWSGTVTHFTIKLVGTGWEGTFAGGESILSWAGYAATYLSTPIFLFLVLRWAWRFFVWTLLLYRISRLPLQLTPLHPDKAGGLGFLSIYPSVFSGLVFAMSCVVASSFLKDLALAEHSATTVWLALAAWMAMVCIAFLGPLLVFVSPLYAARERALLDYARLASEHHLVFHQEWVATGRSGAELLGSPLPSSISDLNASIQAVRDMRTIPVDVPAVSQLVVASGLPLLAVVLKQVPLGDLLKWVAGAIF